MSHPLLQALQRLIEGQSLTRSELIDIADRALSDASMTYVIVAKPAGSTAPMAIHSADFRDDLQAVTWLAEAALWFGQEACKPDFASKVAAFRRTFREQDELARMKPQGSA